MHIDIFKVWLVLFLSLFLRIGVFYLQLPVRQTGQEITLEGLIDTEPTQVGMSQQFSLAGYTISAKLQPEWHYGDHIKITGELMCYDSFRCIRGKIKNPQIELIKSQEINPILLFGREIRQKIEQVYFNSLPADQANLLSGIVLGSIDLDRNFINQLVDVGLTHVVAASGMNITLFAGFIFWIFTIFHLRRPYLTSLSILAIIFYSLITGFSPAVVRAAIMASMGLIGLSWGRKNGQWGGIVTAAYLMLWVDPLLLFNFGFLLSCTSMMGQIALSTFSLKVPNWGTGIRDTLGQTIAAVAFTLPIVLVGFAKFSLISIVTNLLVLWTVEPLMLLGGIAGIIGIWLPSQVRVLYLPAGILLSWFLWVVKLFSNEIFVLKVTDFNIFLVVGYYLLLITTIYYLKHQRVSFIAPR